MHRPTRGTHMTKPVILHVATESDDDQALVMIFRGQYRVEIARDLEQAQKCLSENSLIKAVFIDYPSFRYKGLEFAYNIVSKFPRTAKILVTGNRDMDSIERDAEELDFDGVIRGQILETQKIKAVLEGALDNLPGR